jgi:hypothetical protein
MKKILAAVLSLLCAASVFAFDNDDSIVRWRGIVGVITAPAVDNPVGSIHGGAGPWSVRSGRASVDLVTGNASFEVEALVLPVVLQGQSPRLPERLCTTPAAGRRRSLTPP